MSLRCGRFYFLKNGGTTTWQPDFRRPGRQLAFSLPPPIMLSFSPFRFTPVSFNRLFPSVFLAFFRRSFIDPSILLSSPTLSLSPSVFLSFSPSLSFPRKNFWRHPLVTLDLSSWRLSLSLPISRFTSRSRH